MMNTPTDRTIRIRIFMDMKQSRFVNTVNRFINVVQRDPVERPGKRNSALSLTDFDQSRFFQPRHDVTDNDRINADAFREKITRNARFILKISDAGDDMHGDGKSACDLHASILPQLVIEYFTRISPMQTALIEPKRYLPTTLMR